MSPRSTGTGHGDHPHTPARQRGTAPTLARSTPKARVSARPYSERVKAKALKTVEAEGIAAAHARHKIPKPTLTRWAKAAGIDVGAVARSRTEQATAAVVARAAEVRLSTVQLLEAKLAQAGAYLTTVAGVNALAADRIAALDPALIRIEEGIAGPFAVILDEDAQAASRKALALAGLPLAPRDAEGMFTRAVHDLALLKGEATERGELAVTFNVPRPDARASDAGAVPEDRLAIGGPA